VSRTGSFIPNISMGRDIEIHGSTIRLRVLAIADSRDQLDSIIDLFW